MKTKRLLALLIIFAMLCLTGCQDEEKENSAAATDAVEGIAEVVGLMGDGWTSGSAGKNGAEDERTVLWYLTLENVFSDYDGKTDYHISACIDEFASNADVEASVDLFYNWNIMTTGSVFSREKRTQIKWNAEKQSDQGYATTEYAKSLTAGDCLMEGTVSKSRNDDYEELMDSASKRTKLEVLNQSLMGILGDLYESNTGGMMGLLDAELYLVDVTFYAARVEGTLWVCFAGESPVCLRFMCHQASRSLSDGVVYRYRIDESAEYSADSLGGAMLKLDVALTTAETENVEIPIVAVMAEESQSSEDYISNHQVVDWDSQEELAKLTREKNSSIYGGTFYIDFNTGERLLVGDFDTKMNHLGIASTDVTGDGVPEIVFCATSNVLKKSIIHYGFWQQQNGEWVRLKMAGETAEDDAAMVVQMADIPLKVERISDTELKITSIDAQISETIILDEAKMNQFWPAMEGQAVYPIIRSEDIFWQYESTRGVIGGDSPNRDYRFCASFRLGMAEVTGKLQYSDGYWAITDCTLRQAEQMNDAESYERLGTLHREQWLVILEEALIRFDGALIMNANVNVKRSYDAIFCLPWVFREGVEDAEVDAFFWVSDAHRYNAPDWFRGKFMEREDVLAWDHNYEGWLSGEQRVYSGFAGSSSLVIDSAAEVEFIGNPMDPEAENHADQCKVVELLLGAALRHAGELHLEKAASIEETMKVWIYLLESTYDLDAPRGTLLIQLGESSVPTKVEVAYEGSCREQVTDYQLTVDKNTQPFFTVENAICWRSTITTTDNRQKGLFSEPEDNFSKEPFIDKVLRVMTGTEEQAILLLTSGKTAKMYGFYHRAGSKDDIRCIDLNGDGVEELVYDYFYDGSSLGLDEISYSFRVFERIDDGLEEMRFVTEFGESPLGLVSGTYIPVVIEKTADFQLKVTQVEYGKSVVFDVDEEMFEKLRLDGDQYGPYEKNMYSERIEWDTDPVSGKTILRMHGLVEGRDIPVTWEMMLEDGVWKVTDFYEREP